MPRFEPADCYRGAFYGEVSHAIMANGRILAPSDNAWSLIEKLALRLSACEQSLGELRNETDKRSRMNAPRCACPTASFGFGFLCPALLSRLRASCPPSQVSSLDDCRISQISTATPAEPGELPCY